MSKIKFQIKRYSKILILLKSALVLIVFFQNCGQALDDVDAEGGSEESILSYKAEDMAFDTTVNFMGYFSCSGSSANVPQFKVSGIGGDAGMKLTPKWYSKAKYNSEKQFAKILAEDELNSKALLQLSFRKKNEPLKFAGFLGAANNGAYNYAFGVNLSHLYVARELKELPEEKRLIFLKEKPGHTNRTLDFELFLNNSEDDQRYLRSTFSRDAKMVLGYSAGVDKPASLLGSGSTESPQVFGREYSLTFDVQKRTLSSVSEKNMFENKSDANWSCNSGHQFTIYRPGDPGCDITGTDLFDQNGNKRYSNPTAELAAHIFRRAIDPSGSNWHINIQQKCMVPKQSSNLVCYGDKTEKAIQYSVTNSSCESQADGTVTCPHRYSLCIRAPI